MIAIFVMSLIDLIYADLSSNYPYFCNFLRPVVILIFLSQTRSQMKNIFYYTLKDIAVVLIFIFLYIGFFSLVWFFQFKYSMEGFNFFGAPN